MSASEKHQLQWFIVLSHQLNSVKAASTIERNTVPSWCILIFASHVLCCTILSCHPVVLLDAYICQTKWVFEKVRRIEIQPVEWAARISRQVQSGDHNSGALVSRQKSTFTKSRNQLLRVFTIRCIQSLIYSDGDNMIVTRGTSRQTCIRVIGMIQLSCMTRCSGYRLGRELNIFLTATVMIRRLKKDVQSQLPPKLRSKIPVDCSATELAEIRKLMDKSGIHSLDRSGDNLYSITQVIEYRAKTEFFSMISVIFYQVTKN